MPLSYISCVQSNRKVAFIGMKFSIPLKRYLQSFIKFGQKVCFALEKRIRKTISTCQKKTTVINVLIFNKLDLAKKN